MIAEICQKVLDWFGMPAERAVGIVVISGAVAYIEL